MQSVCFSPMAMLNAWSSGTKPWTFPEVEQQVRDVALLRMRLLPYFYSAFARYHFEGIPPFRAMYLEDEFNLPPLLDNSLTIDKRYKARQLRRTAKQRGDFNDQYMAGDDLLVAPMFAGQTERQVTLPSGKWYDFYTGELAGENEVITVKPGLDEIPLLVRDGGIIPLVPERLYAPGKDEVLELEIRHYGKSEGVFMLYDDDGISFDYETGAHSWTRLAVIRRGDALTGSMKIGNRTAFNYQDRARWVYMTKRSK